MSCVCGGACPIFTTKHHFAIPSWGCLSGCPWFHMVHSHAEVSEDEVCVLMEGPFQLMHLYLVNTS